MIYYIVFLFFNKHKYYETGAAHRPYSPNGRLGDIWQVRANGAWAQSQSFKQSSAQYFCCVLGSSRAHRTCASAPLPWLVGQGWLFEHGEVQIFPGSPATASSASPSLHGGLSYLWGLTGLGYFVLGEITEG